MYYKKLKNKLVISRCCSFAHIGKSLRNGIVIFKRFSEDLK